MLSVESGPQLGTIKAFVTEGRGLNPEELTQMALPKIVYIGPDVPADMRAQAEAGRTRIEQLLLHYFAQAQKSEHTTIYHALMQAGMPEAAELVKDL